MCLLTWRAINIELLRSSLRRVQKREKSGKHAPLREIIAARCHITQKAPRETRGARKTKPETADLVRTLYQPIQRLLLFVAAKVKAQREAYFRDLIDNLAPNRNDLLRKTNL
jgi:hypothetical protein